MLIEALLTMLAVAAPHKAPAALVAPSSIFAATPSPAYQPQTRAVDNWRFESALALEMAPVAAIRRAFGAEAGEPARCVKLNNYWCIKSAGWSGEIAADADGHVAFASAEEGAAVAALLLRRYYVDYGRRTARAIVERWAPAQCSLVVMPTAPRRPAAAPGLPASRGGMARMPPQRVAPMGIAPRGIQNTLRARWLAAHGRGGVNLKTARRPLAKPVDLMPAPSIMAGVSELPARREKLAELIQPSPQTSVVDLPPSPAPRPPPFGVSNCSGELARIATYAANMAQGVVGGANEDLALFTAAGLPTENLAKVMANMAAVEIGPARPRDALIRIAVAQLRQMLEAPAKSGGDAAPAPPAQAPPPPAHAGP
ncbi:hypothetical protein HUN39_05840 [Methylocystis sp. FS]|uniref:hypothetical protein n=1 Tax=Methylocystis silviterrae TaxID=2743612 RepID=UPI001581F952|nr:hypothetical protein [Methylocystis silviterrae]NUJ79548.1 hypothetical protein [Methylocystis silviterrae]